MSNEDRQLLGPTSQEFLKGTTYWRNPEIKVYDFRFTRWAKFCYALRHPIWWLKYPHRVYRGLGEQEGLSGWANPSLATLVGVDPPIPAKDRVQGVPDGRSFLSDADSRPAALEEEVRRDDETKQRGDQMNKAKQGRLVIDYRFISEHPEAVLRLFMEIGFLPLRINHDMINDTVEYAGMSDAFREWFAGEELPNYRMLCHAGENGELDRCWVEEAK